MTAREIPRKEQNSAEPRREMLDALLDLGTRVLGSEERAGQWLESPILSLEGKKPIELLDTVEGYERVKNKLLQIEYGTF